MLAPALLAGLVLAGAARIRVEVIEYASANKAVAGARVTVRDARSGAAPVELRAVADADGRAYFDVDHLDFAPLEVEKEGYVSRKEAEPFTKDLRTLEAKEPRGGDQLFWRVWLVPRAWWNANMKAATREQAVALADEWGRECRAGGPTRVEREPNQSWLVKYACLDVFVEPKSGATTLRVKKPVTGTPMYPPGDALADALSSPLELLAVLQADPHDVPSCAYRNKTVFVVNDYCTKRELNSTGVEVIHPQRGTVHLYAEAKSPISAITREDYDHWHFETYDPYPGASLSMSWAELEKHELRRKRLQDAACYADLGAQPNGSCRSKTEDVQRWWHGVYRPMLRQPPPSWLALVKELRRLAASSGRPDPRGPSNNPVMPAAPLLERAGGLGPFRIIVELEEYMTVKPVAGARVTLRDPSGQNPELTGTTNPKGKVRFDAQGLQYELASVEHPDLLSKEELAPLKDLFQSIDTRRRPHGENEVKLVQSVVNRRWLEATMQVRTADQAVQIAQTWGSECASGPPSRVSRPHAWKVEYPCVVVHVDAWEGKDRAPTVQKLAKDTVSARPLYPPREALADALGSPLRHLGTGVWPGRYKIPSCAYRNAKVIVVDGFCTIKEMNPTTVWIFHPERGAVVFSASGDKGALASKVKRKDYEQWSFGSLEPYPGLALDVDFEALATFEQRRSVFSRGSCQASLTSQVPSRASCSLKAPEVEKWWQEYARPLLEVAPDDWYELMRRVRSLAPKYGRKDPRHE